MVAARDTTGYFAEHDSAWANHALYAFDFAAGKTKWRVVPVLGYGEERNPAVWSDERTLTFRSKSPDIERIIIDVVEGKRVDDWKKPARPWLTWPEGVRGWAEGEKVVALISSPHDLVCLDASDGRVRWKKCLPDEQRMVPFNSSHIGVGAGYVALVTPRGLLRTNIETGESKLTEHAILDNPPSRK